MELGKDKSMSERWMDPHSPHMTAQIRGCFHCSGLEGRFAGTGTVEISEDHPKENTQGLLNSEHALARESATITRVFGRC